MSGSGFGTAADGMTSLAERIADANAQLGNFEFPGQGKAARAFGATQDRLASTAEGMGTWATAAAGICRTQDTIDHGLEIAPTPTRLAELADKARSSGDPADVEAFRIEAEERRLAEQHHKGSTTGNCFPTPPSPSSNPSDPNNGDDGDDGDGTGGQGDLDGDRTEDPDVAGAEDTPVTMSDPGESAPVTMTTGTPEAPVTMSTPISDTNVGTETSADTLTPSTGAGTGQLTQSTQPTPGGTPMQGTHGSPNAAFGATGGAPGQLSQPQGARGVPPQSPEKRREAADKRDEQETLVHTAAGVAGGAAMGTVAGGLSASTPTSPTTNVSGSQAVTPPTNTAAPAGANPAGGGVLGGGVRPPNAAMGSGEQVSVNSMKPIYRTDTPDWLDKLEWDIDRTEFDGDVSEEEPK